MLPNDNLRVTIKSNWKEINKIMKNKNIPDELYYMSDRLCVKIKRQINCL